jgi:hypothetical protein
MALKFGQRASSTLKRLVAESRKQPVEERNFNMQDLFVAVATVPPYDGDAVEVRQRRRKTPMPSSSTKSNDYDAFAHQRPPQLHRGGRFLFI